MENFDHYLGRMQGGMTLQQVEHELATRGWSRKQIDPLLIALNDATRVRQGWWDAGILSETGHLRFKRRFLYRTRIEALLFIIIGILVAIILAAAKS